MQTKQRNETIMDGTYEHEGVEYTFEATLYPAADHRADEVVITEIDGEPVGDDNPLAPELEEQLQDRILDALCPATAGTAERSYRVVWEIDIDACSPKEAAEKALAIQRNPESIATVFDITDPGGRTTRIDLLEKEDEGNETADP